MAKTTMTYWNALDQHNTEQWEVIDETNGLIEQITLSIDKDTGDYTRLTRFKPGANTKSLGSSCHDYPEEIMIMKGRLYDEAFGQWLEPGDYASRPPAEQHGPFIAEEECIVLEISFPSQVIKT